MDRSSWRLLVVTLKEEQNAAGDASQRIRTVLQLAEVPVQKLKRQSATGKSYLLWVNVDIVEVAERALTDIATIRVVSDAESKQRAQADLELKRTREAQAASATVQLEAVSDAARMALLLRGDGGSAKARRRDGNSLALPVSCLLVSHAVHVLSCCCYCYCDYCCRL